VHHHIPAGARQSGARGLLNEPYPFGVPLVRDRCPNGYSLADDMVRLLGQRRTTSDAGLRVRNGRGRKAFAGEA